MSEPTNTVKHTPVARCPFCDGKAEVAYNGPTPEQIQNARSWGDDVDWQFYGQCTHCYATGPACVSASEAAAAWNRRAPQEKGR